MAAKSTAMPSVVAHDQYGRLGSPHAPPYASSTTHMLSASLHRRALCAGTICRKTLADRVRCDSPSHAKANRTDVRITPANVSTWYDVQPLASRRTAEQAAKTPKPMPVSDTTSTTLGGARCQATSAVAMPVS